MTTDHEERFFNKEFEDAIREFRLAAERLSEKGFAVIGAVFKYDEATKSRDSFTALATRDCGVPTDHVILDAIGQIHDEWHETAHGYPANPAPKGLLLCRL